MSRRVSLPGADELFRSTAPAEAAPVVPAVPAVAEPEPTPITAAPPPVAAAVAAPPLDEELAAEGSPAPVRRRPRPAGERRPSGRERHEEKITVYCSADELIDIERTRLALRGDHGLAVDRGRIVREALAIVLADFDTKADQSILVRRLRGR